jgi:hypothetical protein
VNIFGRETDCVTVGNNIYWRNAYLVTDAVRDNAISERAAVVLQNLVTCLRGTALEWYTSELDDLHLAGPKFSQDGIEQWTKVLIQRFKDPLSTA